MNSDYTFYCSWRAALTHLILISPKIINASTATYSTAT